VQNDLVEAVILLSEKFFYNTTVTGIIIVINKAKPQEKKGKILLINASKLFQNGRLKNFLPDESINLIADIYL
jgi:type I restriction enzyme M protein